VIVVICLFALLLVAAIGVSASLVLASCALNLPLGLGALGQCGPTAVLSASASQEDLNRIAVLTSDIGALERQIAGLQCKATPPALRSEPSVVAAPEPPTLAPEPTVEPEPEPAPPEPTADDLTQEDFGRGDIAVLKGCWDLDSVYRTRDEQTGRVYVYDRWSLCFDDIGQGVERMRATSGETCVGPVTGQFTDDRLRITEPANLSCTGGTEIFQRNLDCSLDAEGRANCTVSQPQVGTTSTARLRRAMGEN
jgi:hypothetical protein